MVLVCAALITSRQALGQFTQQGSKLVGIGGDANSHQGTAVALSADGNTAIVGGNSFFDINTDPSPPGGAGAAWVWTRSGGVWTQQGPKLVGSDASPYAIQGSSVAISADGNTAIVGGPGDNGLRGAAWVWTRSGGVWAQQGAKLVGSDSFGILNQGASVSLSADGNTAIIGGYGAAWIWTRSGGVWTQQGTKLVGSGAVGNAGQGSSVSLSADSNTALVGGPSDNSQAGAAWVWTRSGGVWTQQGPKLVGAGAIGGAAQGVSLSLSNDGSTAIVGGHFDNGGAGAAWIWTRSSGTWTQQGGKLIGSSAGLASQGDSVSLAADGNTAIIGGHSDNTGIGAAWIWIRSGGVWTQQGLKLVGSGASGPAFQGTSVSMSSDGSSAIIGGTYGNNGMGAAWIFVANPVVSSASIPAGSVWTLIALAAMLVLFGTLRTRV